MRKVLIALMLSAAVAAAPAMAQEIDAAERSNARMEAADTHQVEVADRGGGRHGGWGGGGRHGGGGGWQQPQAQPAPQAPQAQGWGGRGGGWQGQRSAPVQQAPQADRGWQRGGGWQEQQSAPAQQAPRADRSWRGSGGDNGGWRSRRDGGSTVTPAPVPQAPAADSSRGNRNWGGWSRGGNDDGNRGWRGRRDGNGGVVTPAPQPPLANRGFEGRRDGDGRRWSGNRDNRGWNGDRGYEGRHRDGDRGYEGRHRGGDRDRNRWGRNNGRWSDGRGWDNRVRDRDHGRWNGGSRWEHNRKDWDRGWRSNHRYDWHGYRNKYRSYYSLPRYYNPYGYDYGYQRFGIGIYLDSLFFSSRYWIDDPWYYRLPSAPIGTRWVRYYNDVLLVDTDTGYVIDVIYDFFW